MRYALLTLWLSVSSVATPLPPARAAQALGPPRAPDANTLATLSEDYLHTAFALYHAAAANPGNVVVAPHTAATALAMLYSGARGATAAQLAQALHWRLPPTQLDAAHQALQSTLVQRATLDTNTVIQLASRLWLGADIELVDTYQTLVAQYLGAAAGVVDFANHPDAARGTINQWVSENTQGLIPSLLGPNAVDATTRLVQTSAMYFKANWQYPMDLAATPVPFHNLDGTTRAVPGLDSRSGSHYRYAAMQHYQAVEIFYEGTGLAMDIIVPRGSLADLAPHWHAGAMQELSQAFAGRDVVLHFPKFGIESTQDLGAALRALGVRDVFDPQRSDLSGMVGAVRLRVDAAVSKAKITVDENGTEAAAATAIILAPASAEPGEPVELTVDKPFLFVLRDVARNVMLLMGRVETINPETTVR